MIRPVGINNLQLCQRWVTFFVFSVVFLYKRDVGPAHGKAHLAAVSLQGFRAKISKALYPLNVCRRFDFISQGISWSEIRFLRVYRVDHVLFNFPEFFAAHIALNRNDLRNLN